MLCCVREGAEEEVKLQSLLRNELEPWFAVR